MQYSKIFRKKTKQLMICAAAVFISDTIIKLGKAMKNGRSNDF
jgi:hypothetical protein